MYPHLVQAPMDDQRAEPATLLGLSVHPSDRLTGFQGLTAAAPFVLKVAHATQLLTLIKPSLTFTSEGTLTRTCVRLATPCQIFRVCGQGASSLGSTHSLRVTLRIS